ncbi:hypothetical protein H4P12_03365 [Paracoccus sp. 11-3]|uniref:Uncharacterized protein n=1 Tax=Paracoccus amoyensis TaxID=2760093 RepID=A0A926JA92_9RHOB|nr:DUF6477 family protein [Paracoccus amoyensis]MBC9245771.1 hypothetical protein [Paracoccus amoyensis]
MSYMPNIIQFQPRVMTSGLRRPRMLIRAAREGQSGWRRERDLPRLLRSDGCPKPGTCLQRLRAEEEMQNAARLERRADYDLHRHVLLMIAILAEMRAAIATVAVPATPARQVCQAAHEAALQVINPNDRGTTSPEHL